MTSSERTDSNVSDKLGVCVFCLQCSVEASNHECPAYQDSEDTPEFHSWGEACPERRAGVESCKGHRYTADLLARKPGSGAPRISLPNHHRRTVGGRPTTTPR